MGGNREVTYTVDRHGKPALLNEKESMAQEVINGIFMVPGNIPNIPVGVDIERYLYESSIDPEDISGKLEKTCGSSFMSNNVTHVDCGISTYEGMAAFWLQVHMGVDKNRDAADALGLVITKQDDAVRFNHQFMSDGIKKAYGV